jgi:hypothetical protein
VVDVYGRAGFGRVDHGDGTVELARHAFDQREPCHRPGRSAERSPRPLHLRGSVPGLPVAFASVRRALVRVAVVAVEVGLLAAPARAKVSPGLAGCRLLAALTDTSTTYDQATRAVLARKAVARFVKVKNGELRCILAKPKAAPRSMTALGDGRSFESSARPPRPRR